MGYRFNTTLTATRDYELGRVAVSDRQHDEKQYVEDNRSPQEEMCDPVPGVGDESHASIHHEDQRRERHGAVTEHAAQVGSENGKLTWGRRDYNTWKVHSRELIANVVVDKPIVGDERHEKENQ